MVTVRERLGASALRGLGAREASQLPFRIFKRYFWLSISDFFNISQQKEVGPPVSKRRIIDGARISVNKRLVSQEK